MAAFDMARYLNVNLDLFSIKRMATSIGHVKKEVPRRIRRFIYLAAIQNLAVNDHRRMPIDKLALIESYLLVRTTQKPLKCI